MVIKTGSYTGYNNRKGDRGNNCKTQYDVCQCDILSVGRSIGRSVGRYTDEDHGFITRIQN